MEETITQMNDKILLAAKGITFGYRKNKPVIKNLSLTIRPGEIVGITGENGSGKSTLLKILVGLLKPKEGQMIINGRIGYSPQDLLLFDNLTVMENFLVFGRGMGLSKKEIETKAKDIMDKLQFSQYENTLVKDLSGGTAQKTNFGIALLGDPDVLILDEPYQGMDYASFIAFWDIQFVLRQQGKAIIIVSHLIEDKEKFSRSLHLNQGRFESCGRKNCPYCDGDEPC